MHLIEDLVDLRACEAMWADIPDNLVSVSAVSDELLSSGHQGSSHGSCISDDLSTVLDEGSTVDLLKLDSKSCDLMVVRTTLQHREHCKVDLFKKRFLAEDDSGAGTSQGLVCRRGDDVTEWERVRHELSCHETTDVGNVSHKIGADAVCDLAETCVVKISWVCASTANEHLGLELGDGSLERVHIDQTSLLVDEVWARFEVK